MINTYNFYPIDSRMYILLEHEKALILDPCISDKALQSLEENHTTEALVLLTHEHYDHISGVNWLREHVPVTHVMCSSACAAALPDPYKNLSIYWEILFLGKEKEIQEYVRNMNIQPYSCEADSTFAGKYKMSWAGHSLSLQETPGHSRGSICILLDETILFSGDSLVSGHSPITRLPGGSKEEYAEITLPYLHSLDPSIMVYPGHGEKQPLGCYPELQI